MTPNDYPEPVSKLLELGETDWDEWDDYSQWGFTPEHISDLIRLGTDHTLILDLEDHQPAHLWAPLHAWRALAQMEALEAIPPFVELFALDSDEINSDLISEGLLEVLVQLGPPAIEPLEKFLNDPDQPSFGYISAAETLALIGQAHPETRARIVLAITSALEQRYQSNEGDVNGFWIADLLDLQAVESYPVIKKAFEENTVDFTIAGDLEDVEIALGLRQERETPVPRRSILPDDLFRSLVVSGLPATLNSQQQRERAKKEKNKQKQEKKSRKKNRKKKK